jgi:hypothetical protein
MLALLERLDARVQTLSERVDFVDGRLADMDSNDPNAPEDDFMEMKRWIVELSSTGDDVSRKLDSFLASRNDPEAWAANMENLVYHVKELRKQRDDQLAAQLDLILEILKSGDGNL